jgi:hypothetical protein
MVIIVPWLLLATAVLIPIYAQPVPRLPYMYKSHYNRQSWYNGAMVNVWYYHWKKDNMRSSTYIDFEKNVTSRRIDNQDTGDTIVWTPDPNSCHSKKRDGLENQLDFCCKKFTGTQQPTTLSNISYLGTNNQLDRDIVFIIIIIITSIITLSTRSRHHQQHPLR